MRSTDPKSSRIQYSFIKLLLGNRKLPTSRQINNIYWTLRTFIILLLPQFYKSSKPLEAMHWFLQWTVDKAWPLIAYCFCIHILQNAVLENKNYFSYQKWRRRGAGRKRHTPPHLNDFAQRLKTLVTTTFDQQVHSKIPCLKPFTHLHLSEWA